MKPVKNNPPGLFLRFFRWYCHPRPVDHIEGDLLEVYGDRVKKLGRTKADIRFMIDVVLLFRPRIIKPVGGYKYPGRDGKQKPAGGYGASLKGDYRYFYGATFGMSGRGEAIAREDNYCEIDPSTVDKYGIPVLRFHYKWSDYEVKQAKHMKETFREIIHNAGGVVTSGDKDDAGNDYGLAAPGRIIHEVGTTRMGNDPGKSVVNKFNQAHECKNLFVVDGGPFVSQADKNPTWTILALSMRASEFILEEMKKQNL